MIRSNYWKSDFIVLMTILLAVFLSVMPLPAFAIWLRPCWVVMVVIYWAMALPQRFNVGFAWCIGIAMDVLQNTLLGMHALVLTLITYFIVKWHLRLRLFPAYQQTMAIFGFLLLYQLLLFWPEKITHHSAPPAYWLASVTSCIIWPWLFQLLRAIRRHWQVR